MTYRDQREVGALDSWAQIAAIVAYRGNPGDAVIDYPLVSAITVSYPGALGTGPVLNAGADRLSRHYLWDERLPLQAVEPRLRGVQRLWYLSPVADEVQRTDRHPAAARARLQRRHARAQRRRADLALHPHGRARPSGGRPPAQDAWLTVE